MFPLRIFCKAFDRFVKLHDLARKIVLGLFFLRFGPVQRHVLPEDCALGEFTGALPILPDRIGNAPDLVMRGRYDQHGTRFAFAIWRQRGLTISRADFLRPEAPVHLADRPHRFQPGETFRRATTERLHRRPIFSVGLPPDLPQRHAIQLRFPFEHAKSIAFGHALDLRRVAGVENTRTFVFGETNQVCHFFAAHHAGLIQDQNLPCELVLLVRVREQSRDGHRLSIPDLTQLLDRAGGRSDGHHAAASFAESPVDCLQQSGLARARRATDIKSEIARFEYCPQCLLLFGLQAVRPHKFKSARQRFVPADPAFMVVTMWRSRSRLACVATSPRAASIARLASSVCNAALISGRSTRPRPCRRASVNSSYSLATDTRSNTCSRA